MHSITITNSSKETILMIVEYVHFVEELAPDHIFRINVTTSDNIDMSSFFDINFFGDKIVIELNNDISKYFGKYKVDFINNDILVYSQLL